LVLLSVGYIKYTAYTKYQVNYNGRTSYVSNYFYGRIRSEGRLYDAERDLLAIAKFLVILGTHCAHFVQ